MARKNLILIHRGEEYERDFDEIADKVHALDPELAIFHLPCGLKAALPQEVWQHPTLTVALNAAMALQIKRGAILRCRPLDKIAQQARFREHGIPTPPALPFHFGMKLDPLLFGDFVMLKPLDPKLTSNGKGMMVMRRKRAEALRLADLGADHPFHETRGLAMVQRFIPTGDFPASYRVTTLLGEVLFMVKIQSSERATPLTASDAEIETGHFTMKRAQVITVEAHPDMIDLGRRVAGLFPDIPLLGIDILRHAQSSNIYVLEVNAGGNTWHFSSQRWAPHHKKNPQLAADMKAQFGAFDRSAAVLVDHVHRLAT